MEYVRTIDAAALAPAPPGAPYSEWLLDHTTGGRHCSVNYIRTPAGGGSPAGLHTHVVDQIFYVLSGVMSIEIDGRQQECPPGSLIVFPAGVPHRNWNAGPAATVHLAV